MTERTIHLVMLIAIVLMAFSCRSVPTQCDQPLTYYNSPSDDLWPHCPEKIK